MAEEGDISSESGSTILNEDVSSVASSVATSDSAYGSSGSDSQPPAANGKKKVCFETDDSLVKVFEIPYDYDDVPLPEELEPCNPMSLVQKFDDLTLQSVVTTKYGSYALPSKKGDISKQATGLEDINVSIQEGTRQMDNNHMSSAANTKRVEKKHGHSKKPRSTLQIDKFNHSFQHDVNHEPHPDSNTSAESSTGHVVHCTKKKRTDKGSYPSLSREKPRRDCKAAGSRLNHTKADRKLADFHDLLHQKSRTRGYLQKSNSVDSIGLNELRRPKSCTSLPTLHLSPYRRVSKPNHPVVAKSITFPDFIGQGPAPSLGKTRTEPASWAKMSFISKDSSPPSERRDNGSATASKKLYSWKVANGIIKPVDITTSSITPMWENLTLKPSTAEANSVLSAL